MRNTFLVIFILIATLGWTHEPDTLYAVVETPSKKASIKDQWLFPDKIDLIIDSLYQNQNTQLGDHLFWIHKNAILSYDAQSKIMDSLFNCSPIPYETINNFNTYLSRIEKSDYSDIIAEKKVNLQHPFFKNWDTQHPFLVYEKINRKDSFNIRFDSSKFTYPVPYKAPYKYHATVTSNFGWRSGRHHRGIDIELHVKDSVVSAFDGVVRLAKYYGGYGRVVVVRHFNGAESLYAHLYRFKVGVGDTVRAGQLIALGGNSGHSEGSHLHFEIRYDGSAINPAHIIDTQTKQLKGKAFVIKKHRDNYVALIAGQKYHKVQPGDHWYKIANRYGLEVQQLYQLNGIKRPHRLSVGEMIRVGT